MKTIVITISRPGTPATKILAPRWSLDLPASRLSLKDSENHPSPQARLAEVVEEYNLLGWDVKIK